MATKRRLDTSSGRPADAIFVTGRLHAESKAMAYRVGARRDRNYRVALQPARARCGRPLAQTRRKWCRSSSISDAGRVRASTVKLPMVVKSDDEWRQQLTPLAFAVTRRGADRAAVLPVPTGTSATRACTDASAATPRCSARTRSFIPTLAGRASGRRWRKRTSGNTPTTGSACPASRSRAAGAMRIWDMSSMTAPTRPAFATA